MYKTVEKEVKKIAKETRYSEESLMQIAKDNEYRTDRNGKVYRNGVTIIMDEVKRAICLQDEKDKMQKYCESDIAEYFDCGAVEKLLNSFGNYLGMTRRGMSLDEFQNELHNVFNGLKKELKPLTTLAEMEE